MDMSINKKAMSKFCIALAAFFATCLTACSSTETPINYKGAPALWEVSDNDTQIYIFGTAPVLTKNTEWTFEPLLSAFRDSDLMIVETDNSLDAQTAVQTIIPKIGLYQNGRTLSESLTAEQAEELNSFTMKMGVSLEQLNALKPWLASIQIGALALSQGDYDLSQTPIIQLEALAKEQRKTTKPLESSTFLMSKLLDLPENEQVEMLMHTVRLLRDQPNHQADLAAAWLDGDQNKIADLLHGPDGVWSSDTIYEIMLVERNKTWVKEISNLMETHKGTVFFTIGLGHLAGPDNLLNRLSEKDFKVTRIAPTPN